MIVCPIPSDAEVAGEHAASSGCLYRCPNLPPGPTKGSVEYPFMPPMESVRCDGPDNDETRRQSVNEKGIEGDYTKSTTQGHTCLSKDPFLPITSAYFEESAPSNEMSVAAQIRFLGITVAGCMHACSSLGPKCIGITYYRDGMSQGLPATTCWLCEEPPEGERKPPSQEDPDGITRLSNIAGTGDIRNDIYFWKKINERQDNPTVQQLTWESKEESATSLRRRRYYERTTTRAGN